MILKIKTGNTKEEPDSIFPINSWAAHLSISDLLTFFDENVLQQPKFKREYVWDRYMASRFIESLLLGLPLPTLIFAKLDAQLIIIDGYQRVKTIFDFVDIRYDKIESIKLDNSKGINSRLRGLSYQELTSLDQWKLKSATIHSIIFEISTQMLFEIFSRFNNRLPPKEISRYIRTIYK